MIWVSCDGENSADREHIGNVTYTPFRGFPAYYFPYKNVPGYLSPIVALQFQKPEGMFLIELRLLVIGNELNRILISCFSWRSYQHRMQSLGQEHHSRPPAPSWLSSL